MKYLKLYESFEELKAMAKNHDAYLSINNLCKRLNINNYTINDDLTVDINGNLSIKLGKIGVNERFPLNFNRVTGDFYCYFDNLLTLEGCPKWVGRDFSCSNNGKLSSFKFGPEYIGRNFNCFDTDIWNFDYFPKRIGGEFYCNGSPIYEIYSLFGDISRIPMFQEYDIIREQYYSIKKGNLRIIIKDRLVEFLKDINLEDQVHMIENIKSYILI